MTCCEPGCERRYGLEWDHIDPMANQGPTSFENLAARCYPHHQEKTKRDRAAGLPRRPEQRPRAAVTCPAERSMSVTMVDVQRVSVVGNSGSGKSTFARALAERLGVDHVELDAIVHQPDWRELPVDEFRRAVGDRIAAPGWVVDGNYSQVQDLVWNQVDTVVWLDFPRRVVMRRIVTRSVSRLVRQQELWNGNREHWSNLLSRDPMRSIIVWAWTRHSTYEGRYGTAMNDPAWAQVRFVRVKSPRAARELLRR